MTLDTPATQDVTDLYDALTIELERAEVLTEHLTQALHECGRRHRDCYALALVAGAINERHARMRVKARALLSAAEAAESGGAPSGRSPISSPAP